MASPFVSNREISVASELMSVVLTVVDTVGVDFESDIAITVASKSSSSSVEF